jgi:cob(I)alamin adenosyltransferase
MIIYLNRLSDFLFVLARFVNLKENKREIIWTKNKK